MLVAAAILVAAAAVWLTLAIRERDLPPPEPVSPFQALDEKKARIYENLKDLQFELRLGKLSDDDYQKSKQALQKELAGILAEIDAIKAQMGIAKPGGKKK